MAAFVPKCLCSNVQPSISHIFACSPATYDFCIRRVLLQKLSCLEVDINALTNCYTEKYNDRVISAQITLRTLERPCRQMRKKRVQPWSMKMSRPSRYRFAECLLRNQATAIAFLVYKRYKIFTTLSEPQQNLPLSRQNLMKIAFYTLLDFQGFQY